MLILICVHIPAELASARDTGLSLGRGGTVDGGLDADSFCQMGFYDLEMERTS